MASFEWGSGEGSGKQLLWGSVSSGDFCHLGTRIHTCDLGVGLHIKEGCSSLPSAL